MSNLKDMKLRFIAIQKKEFIIMLRDKRTYFFLILIPLIQVILFGYIINSNAKHLTTIVVKHDDSPFVNSIIHSLSNSEYFKIQAIYNTDNDAKKLMESGKVQFIVYIPEQFTHDLIRNKQPHMLIEGDGSDPMLIGNAFSALNTIALEALKRDAIGPLSYLKTKEPAFIIDRHAKYNSAGKAQYHTLPGLIVSIITISLTMLTAISITTEYEEGTMELLLVTPIHPLEVMFGKIVPNIILGYILFYLTLFIARYLFHVPFYGSVLLLSIIALPFFIANLGIGIVTSSLSKTQFQAANIASTYALPAILFCGFMFPFAAMPVWAQWIGNLLPPTYFLRITSDVMLKGAGFAAIWPNLWPILVFTFMIILIGDRSYRQTLD